ncbi:hypothetical protein HPB47_020768 [Ixodes persulcatus]|uniref:Uncharacterized protein n=1 Tax=Ixodes persulcatus TaxID=34615 RepID=A0AC60QEG0_IXOPE|nr:hypothetical protein HPB47_020768 [Ixodes persulcatus]
MDLPATVIATFQNLRRIEKLFDAVLRTDDGTVFKVHRLVLAAACPLFKALFMADHNNLSNDVRAGAGEPPSQEMHEYWLTDISRETLALLIDFCYGVPLEERVRLDTVQYILSVAEKYKVWTSTPAYTTLSSTELIRVVQSDELQVVDEVSGTFRAIMRWVEANSEHRQADLAALLGHVRFGFCKSRCYDEVINHPFIWGNPDCEHIVASLGQLMEQLESWEGGPQLVNPEQPWLRPRVPRDVLFVIGGWSNGSAINLIETYDCRADRWLIFSSDTGVKPRAYHGVAVLDGLIYVVGGFDGTECFNSVICMEPQENKWCARSCMHYARCYVSVAVLHGSLYAMGGYDGERRTATTERYDPAENQWTLVADMHEARSDACAAVAFDRIYVVGGFTGREVLNTIEYYDPTNNTWNAIRAMNSPRSGVRVMTFREQLYVIGGFNGTNRLSSVEKYDIKRERWTDVPSMTCPRSNFAVTVLEDTIYVIGGFNGTLDIGNSKEL